MNIAKVLAPAAECWRIPTKIVLAIENFCGTISEHIPHPTWCGIKCLRQFNFGAPHNL